MVKLVWRLSGVFMEETWQIKLPEWFVWILYGDSVESDAFDGDFMAKSFWRLSGENMAKQIIRKSLYYFYHKPPCYLHNFYIL